MSMIVTYMKCVYIHVPSLVLFREIVHIQLYTLGKMNTLEVTVSTLDTGMIPPNSTLLLSQMGPMQHLLCFE